MPNSGFLHSSWFGFLTSQLKTRKSFSYSDATRLTCHLVWNAVSRIPNCLVLHSVLLLLQIQ